MLKAIETRYKGYRFRSRLEARWAVFFDTLGVVWEYEKEGFELDGVGRYLPDFWLPQHEIWVEIKGEATPEGQEKADALQAASGKKVFTAEGSIGEHHWHSNIDTPPFRIPITNLSPNAGISTMLQTAPEWDYPAEWGVQMRCPVCGYDYVHVDAATHMGGDNYSAWQGRGNAARIEMSCEDGHTWVLRFGFHKGSSFFAIESTSQESHDLGLWLAGGDKRRYDTAIAAARSARFEYGQTPR